MAKAHPKYRENGVFIDNGGFYASGIETITNAQTGGTAASGTITSVTKANMVDTETVTISDGVTSVEFEFDVAGDGIAGAGTAVDVSGDTTAADTAATLHAAINAHAFDITSTDNEDGTLSLVNDGTGAVGNVTITETVANAGFLVTGMSGGVDDIADPDIPISLVSITGTTRFTLADGTRVGQRKTFTVITAASTPDGTLVPASFADGTSVDLDAVSESIELFWDGSNWRRLHLSGATITA